MNMKLAGGILAVGLAALASYADGDEPEVPVIKAATFVAGTGNAFLATSWSNNEVPDAFTDIYIDGNTDVASVANAATNSACSFALHNIKIDKGDSLNLSISSATLSLTANAITNNGSLFISDASSSNDKNITLNAVGGPFYNGPDGVVEVAAKRQGNNRTINLRAGGSVNDGTIIIRHTCSTYRDHSKVYLKDDGVFINNGTIQIKSGGKCTKTGSTDLSSSELVLSARQLLLSGTGTVTLDLSGASDTTVRAELNATNYNCEIVNDVNHTIQGEGVIKSMHLLNKGLIRSRGENRALRWEIPGYRDYKLVTTNDVSGRVVAASEKGVSISYPSRPQRNTRFVSFGLMEARAGSVIAFANGVNSTSDAIPDGDLSPTSGDYLKLWGRIAGGGRFQTIRPIHIMDGARLMPGDLANDDGTGDSTCGTLTFATNLVLEAGAALEEGDGVSSGAITEFQCVKTEAGRFDAVWVEGDLTVAGTLRFTAKPHSGTYRIFGATGALTCDLETLAVECAPGVSAPHLKLVEGTYSVEQPKLDGETGEPLVDEETGEPLTETVQLPCRYLEATWANGLSVSIR